MQITLMSASKPNNEKIKHVEDEFNSDKEKLEQVKAAK